MAYKEKQIVAGNEYDTPYLYDVAHLRELVKENKIEEIKQFMKENDLVVKNHKIMSKYDDMIQKQSGFWKLWQQVRKIGLNSSYGMLLSSSAVWYDDDQGRSITLSGQNITKHMSAFGIKEMTGDYDYLNKGVTHNDTDSVYISISNAFATKGKEYNMSIDELVEYADEVGEHINDSFPEFMHKTFGTDLEHGGIIKAGRENVFYSCLCIVKKHYAGLVVNSDGHSIYSKLGIEIPEADIKKKYMDIGIVNGKHYVHLNGKGIVYKEKDNLYYPLGKLKITGLDELRSDVSPEVKNLLRKILCIILLGGTKNQVEDLLIEKYNELQEKSPWELGMPKSCRNVSEWEEKIGIYNGNYAQYILEKKNIKKEEKDNTNELEASETFGNVNVPATASACINWNTLRLVNNDMASPQLMNGHRLIFLKVKYPNKYNIKNIGLPYDIDIIPQWFKELPFDTEAMVNSILMKKVENLTAPMDWKFDLHKNVWDEQFDGGFDYE